MGRNHENITKIEISWIFDYVIDILIFISLSHKLTYLPKVYGLEDHLKTIIQGL